jgi:hypothetical protein
MSEPLTPAERVDDIPRILRALRESVQDALRRHKRDGHPVAVWQNDRVEWIQPEDIPMDDPLVERREDDLP